MKTNGNNAENHRKIIKKNHADSDVLAQKKIINSKDKCTKRKYQNQKTIKLYYKKKRESGKQINVITQKQINSQQKMRKTSKKARKK